MGVEEDRFEKTQRRFRKRFEKMLSEERQCVTS
jgi:hypothetical protein